VPEGADSRFTDAAALRTQLSWDSVHCFSTDARHTGPAKPPIDDRELRGPFGNLPSAVAVRSFGYRHRSLRPILAADAPDHLVRDSPRALVSTQRLYGDSVFPTRGCTLPIYDRSSLLGLSTSVDGQGPKIQSR